MEKDMFWHYGKGYVFHNAKTRNMPEKDRYDYLPEPALPPEKELKKDHYDYLSEPALPPEKELKNLIFSCIL